MDIANMLRRLLGDDITLVTDLGSEPWDVSADPGQVDQIIINIAVNARDAMERGGTIAIQTKNVHLDDGYSSSHVGVAPGDYVAMSISDTGAGMSEETKARIFEPFFTTKEPGHGTGLGLSTVYGIVKQSGGNIWVYSELGKGTTFTIYLPRFSGDTPRPALPQSAIQEATGREHILIVEDDPTVRTLVAAMLSQCGYTTLAAASGEEALQICADLSVQVDLVVSDLVMPGMDGRDVGRHALELRPGIQLLFMSGYTEHAVLRRNIFEPGIFFLQKPFSHVALARKVREILDGTRAE
jgi:CheY-like chemotaxis protein